MTKNHNFQNILQGFLSRCMPFAPRHVQLVTFSDMGITLTLLERTFASG